jgi:VWFA-related protein
MTSAPRTPSVWGPTGLRSVADASGLYAVTSVERLGQQEVKWLPTVALCAVAACAAQTMSPPLKSSGNAWLLFIDDTHLDFRNTGRLRDLLKMVANQVIKDGDAFMVRSSGPSQVAIEWTMDRSRLQSELRKTTGNALRLSDTVDNRSRDPLVEVRYRAGIAMAFASELVSAARFVQARSISLIYVSNGYDLEDAGFRVRLQQLAELARDANVRIFPINPRMVLAGHDLDLAVDAERWQKHLATTQQSLRLLADETGGLATSEVQDVAVAVKKIAAFRR